MDTSVKKTTTATMFHKKRKSKKQADFLQKLGELLAEGFSMKDALDFVRILSPNEEWVEEVQYGVAQGGRLDEELIKVGFPEQVTSQLFLAYVHGHLPETLIGCGRQMKEYEKRKREVAGLLQYPLLLIVFISGMLLSMRYILLPHMDSMTGFSTSDGAGLTRLALGFVYYSPYWLPSIGLFVGFIGVGIQLFMKRKSALEKAALLSRLPLFGTFVRYYYTHRFGKEWSLLFKSGLNLQEIVQLMQNEGASQLMREVGQGLENQLRQGHGFEKALHQFPFFLKEMGLVILHGESTGKVGIELELYARDCFKELNRRMQKLFQYIQPLLFLLIALMIIAIYAAMLLPMFSMVKEMG